jgi:hypothetical protein
MGKKFKGKTCVYCARNLSDTGDHVFAREFFLPHMRGILPKVPACNDCNNEKSGYEHYLASLLPFGARHGDARITLETMVQKRLAQNLKLHRALSQQQMKIFSKENGRLYRPTIALPFHFAQLKKLFEMVVKGLVWYHWQTLITEEYSVQVLALTKVGEEFFEHNFFALNTRARVNVSLVNGAFSYEGVQGVDYPQITARKFSVYGGIKLSESTDAPDVVSSRIGAVTGPKPLLSDH